MSKGPEWFAPKRYGYGSGLPIAWQGWAVTIAFLVLLGIAIRLMRYSHEAFFSIVAIATTLLVLTCARTTRGGWRWRWGERD